MAAAVLTIDINARLAKLEEGLNKTVGAVGRSSKAIESSLAGLNSAARAFGGVLAAALSVATFTRLIKGAIDAEDKLNDLSKATGVAVETLGGIGFAASQSGSDLDSVAKGFGKLNLTIAKATSGNEEAAKVFSKIGISVRELRASSPDEIFGKIADKFSSYEDGADKAALGNAIFGKSYMGLLPLLDEGGERLRQNIGYFEKYGGITKESAARADEFNDTLAKLHLLSGGFGRTLASTVLPTLQTLANHFVEAKEKGGGLSTIAEGLGRIFNLTAAAGALLAGFVVKVGDSMGALAVASKEILSGNLELSGRIFEDLRARNAETTKQYQALANAILAGETKVAGVAAATNRGRSKAPSLGSGDADDAARKILEGRIKAFENAIRSEQDILKDREHFLQAYYQDDQLGIKEYFSKRQEIILDALAKELAAYDGQIAELKAFAAKATPKERLDAENQIADRIAKQSKAQQDASRKGIDLWLEERKAAALFRGEVEDIAIALAALGENSVDAGAAAFDKQFAKFKAQAELQIQSADEMDRKLGAIGLRDLELLKKRTVEQLQLNEATDKFGAVLDKISLAQTRIDIAVNAGMLTELEALRKTSDLHATKIAQLTKEADAYEVIARAIADPKARDAALANLEAMRVKVEELAATGDLVAKKFNDIGASGLSEALQKIANGSVKSFKDLLDVVNDLGKSLAASINKIAADEITSKLFKGGGALSGFGDFFSKLFGGKGAAGGAADVGGAAALTGAGTALTGAGATLTASSAALDLSAVGITTAAAAQDLSAVAMSTAAGLHTAAATALTGAAAALSASAVPAAASGVGAVAEAVGAAGVTTADASLVALSATTTAADASMLALSTTTTLSDAAMLTFSTTAGLTTAAMGALTGAAGAAAAALATVAASSAASSVLGSFVGPSLATFAVGTPYVPRDMLAIVHKGERITPAAQNRGVAQGGNVTNNHFTIQMPPMGGSSTQTDRQRARMYGKEITHQMQRG